MTDAMIERHAGCLLCTVRAMTEGTPPAWNGAPDLAEGSSVSGVVLRIGESENAFGTGRFVDLWTDESEIRVRVLAYSSVLQRELRAAEVKVGDRLAVTYLGQRETTKGRTYRAYEVTIERGHH